MNTTKNVLMHGFAFIETHFRLTRSANVLTIAILIQDIPAGMIRDGLESGDLNRSCERKKSFPVVIIGKPVVDGLWIHFSIDLENTLEFVQHPDIRHLWVYFKIICY